LLTEIKDMDHFKELSGRSYDFKTTTISLSNQDITISYFNTLIDEKVLQQQVIHAIQNRALDSELKSMEDLLTWIPVDDIEITDKFQDVQSKVLKGYAAIHFNHNQIDKYALVSMSTNKGMRENNDTENEFSVVGPKVGFVEDISTNIRLLRAQINIPNLVVKDFTIGTVSKTKVAIVYIEGVTNKKYIETVEQRLCDMDFDVVFDSSQLEQIISDNSKSPFPIFLSTERRDRVVYGLISGQVAITCDGSPYFVTGPSSIFDSFISPEDYYLPWVLGSFFRIIRILGVLFSLFASSMYLVLTTYHYEVIPMDLLGPLIFSRQDVPFPPVVEVLFLEVTIEFLREAGARLPTKISQTLGIVGGVILGQAAVEAGLTSNILIIITALSALASFTTPLFKMSNTIRYLRFPIIFLSSLWGGIGMFIGITFILIHLTQLKSLGAPYTVPLYPLRVNDWGDSFIRSSYKNLNKRPGYLRPTSILRYVIRTDKFKKDFTNE
jgi:spore germination protein KA